MGGMDGSGSRRAGGLGTGICSSRLAMQSSEPTGEERIRRREEREFSGIVRAVQAISLTLWSYFGRREGS